MTLDEARTLARRALNENTVKLNERTGLYEAVPVEERVAKAIMEAYRDAEHRAALDLETWVSE